MRRARRFVNEALSYHEFVLAMLRDGNDAAKPLVLSRLRPPFSLDLRARPDSAFHRAPQAIRQKRRIDRGAEHRSARRGDRRREIGALDNGRRTTTRMRGRARPGIRTRQHHLSASPRRCRPLAQSLRRADRAAAVLRACGSFRRISARRSACRTDGHARVLRKDGGVIARALCLRQRHGLDHERKLSGARHHARAGPDLRLHRRPAPCADRRRRRGQA